MARLRLQAPVRRLSSKEARDPVNIQNILEFNELKHKGRQIFLLLMKKSSEASILLHATQDLRTEIKVRLFTVTAHIQHTLQTAFCICIYLSVWLFLQLHTIHIVMPSYHSEYSPSFQSLLLKFLKLLTHFLRLLCI